MKERATSVESSSQKLNLLRKGYRSWKRVANRPLPGSQVVNPKKRYLKEIKVTLQGWKVNQLIEDTEKVLVVWKDQTNPNIHKPRYNWSLF